MLQNSVELAVCWCRAGFWTFLWFVCFCYLADAWRRTTYDNPELGESGVEAAIVFSFFSIGTFVRIHQHDGHPLGNGSGRRPRKWIFRLKRRVFSERERSLYAIARPSVVCLSSVSNVRAPYSGGSDFRQYFYGIRYLGHPRTSTENFVEIVPGEPLRRGS